MLMITASGVLVSAPVRRGTGERNPFVECDMRCPLDGYDVAFITLRAFHHDAMIALGGLKKGNPIHVVGRGRIATWEKNGIPSAGLAIAVDEIKQHTETKPKVAQSKTASEANGAGQPK